MSGDGDSASGPSADPEPPRRPELLPPEPVPEAEPQGAPESADQPDSPDTPVSAGTAPPTGAQPTGTAQPTSTAQPAGIAEPARAAHATQEAQAAGEAPQERPREEVASAPEPTSARPPDQWWRSTRLLIGAGGGAAVAIALVVLLSTALVPGDDAPETRPGARKDLMLGSLATPKTVQDPVPKGPMISKIPKACGVAAKTARELVPGSDAGGRERGLFANTDPGHCRWYALNDGEERRGFVPNTPALRKERVLYVDIALNEASALASAVGSAMESVRTEKTRIGRVDPAATNLPGAPRPVVSGLGEEAWLRYSPAVDEGATAGFRVGNAYVTVQYTGWDRKGDDPVQRQVPEDAAVAGVLKAAAGVAKNIGVQTPSTPSVAPQGSPRAAAQGGQTPPAAGRAIRRPPRPCDAVSPETLVKVANGAYRERGGSSQLGGFGLTSDTCDWSAQTATYDSGEDVPDSQRTLEVTIGVATDPQLGAVLATREYLRMHLNARDSKPDDTLNQQRGFVALGGLGEQAFAAYGKFPQGGSQAPGRVVFRLRNVVVQVVYHDGGENDEAPLGKDEAINGAYTVALDVLRSLSRAR
jgi:hypothetical protein